MAKYTSYHDVMDSKLERVVLTGPDCMAQIAPGAGLNIYSWIIGGREIMMPTQDVGAGGAGYGTPILFPTPNRKRDCTYTFEGETHTLMKKGEKRFIHGLMIDEPFAYRHWADDDAAYCEGTVVIAEGGDLASGYPYPCTLTVLITFSVQGITMDFKVENQGKKNMPFGLAIHPYFTKTGNPGNVYLSCPAERYFTLDEQLIPTGELNNIFDHPDHDLRELTPVATANADTVYDGMDETKTSRIEFRDWGIGLTLSADRDFKKAVVYTPPYRPGFCIEPQTCATDFINLYARGMKDESGILILEPGKTWNGQIRMMLDTL